MHFDMADVAATFMIGPHLFVVNKRGEIFKFAGWNNWTQAGYLPVGP